MAEQNCRISLEELILKLYDIDCFKFGKFVLKSGKESPIYIDLRVIISYPDILLRISQYMWDSAKNGSREFTSVCGVPYTALPLATCISTGMNVPMLLRRKEKKTYGTCKEIEGVYSRGDTCLVVEDVATTGSSILETVEALNMEGILVKDAVVLLDRDQGAKTKLLKSGISLHSVLTVNRVLDVLESAHKIDIDLSTVIRKYISDNRFAFLSSENSAPVKTPTERCSPSPKRKLDVCSNGSIEEKGKKHQVMSYAERASLCSHPLSKQLFQIMEQKKTNLALSLDVTTSRKAVQLLDVIGPHICLVKTHIDIVSDFSHSLLDELVTLSKKHSFLIFEDRKFADIGNTVVNQYSCGVHRISDWAHLVSAHVLPGDGVIQGLKQVGLKQDRGCLLIAQMSSQGDLITESYTKACVQMADDHDDFVVGFICQKRISDNPEFIHMCPGIRLARGNDNLGQTYSTPEAAISEKLCDVIIVGRGILEAADPLEEARRYQQAGYNAYEELLNSQIA